MGELDAPLRGSLAVAAGLVTKSRLRGPGFRRLFPDVYLPAHLAPTLAMRSRGAHLLVAGRGVPAGYSAAELLGARIAPRDSDAEVVAGRDVRECRGLRVHRERLAEDEVETVAGLVVPPPSAPPTTWPTGPPSWRGSSRPTRWAGSGGLGHPRWSRWPLATPGRGGAGGFRWSPS